MRATWLLVLVVAAVFVGRPTRTAHAEGAMYAGTAEVPYKRKRDAMKAREDAIEAATADALRKALPDFMPRDVFDTNQDRFETELLPTASALIERSEITSEKDRDKTYIVVVRAWIDKKALGAALDSMGMSQDVASRRTIAVIIDEFFAGDSIPSSEPMVARELEVTSVNYGRTDTVDAKASSEVDAGYEADVSAAAKVSGSSNTRINVQGNSATDRSKVDGSASYSDDSKAHYNSSDAASLEARSEEAYSSFALKLKENFPPEALRQPRQDPASGAAIAARLLGRDCRLADDSVVSSLRADLVGPDGMLADLIADPSALSTRAAALGASHGVDAVMIGTTAVVYNGAKKGGHAATANLAVRIVDTATGDIVAYAVRNNSGSGGDSQSAASAAASRLGDLLGQDLGDQLFSYWKKRDEKGIEISFRVVGVDSTRLNLLLEDLLRGVEGMESVEQRVFDRSTGVAEYVLTTRKSPTEFKSTLLRRLYSEAAFDKLEEELSLGTKWLFRLQ